MPDQYLYDFLHYGTHADRLAFSPSPPGNNLVYIWYETDTGDTFAYDGSWNPVGGGSGTGDVVGPGSATDKGITRFDGTTGKLIQDTSGPILEDDGRISNLTDPTGIQDGATKFYVDDQIAANAGTGAVQNSFLVSGGQVTWLQNYDFLVSAANYYILGVLFTSPQTTITLDPADLTDDRIDTIAVDDTGSVIKVTGTAAPNPSEPDIDPGSQLKIAIVFVAASSTAPTVSNEVVYFQNAGGPTEWNWATSGSGFNVNSTNNPKAPATKDIEGTSVSNTAYAHGTIPSSSYNPNLAVTLTLYIRSKATWANNRGLTVSLRTAGVLQGTAVNINRTGSFGFDSSIVGSYQLVAIPISLFAIPAGTTVTQVRITAFGSGHGFYLADIYFQEGGVVQPPVGITQPQADARYLQRANNLSDLTTVATARTNLGLGALAVLSTVDEAHLAFTNITTADVSITKHGLTPILPNDSTKFLNGVGGYTVPPGTSGSAITALTGDVTATGPGSVAATIAALAVTTGKINTAAVTFAKIQNIATDSLIGRDTAGTGVPENILLNATLSMDGSGNLQRAALTGDVTASAGSNATTLANTAVTPGSYTNTDLTVDAKGRITAASNGSAGGSGITTLTGDVTAGPGSGSQAATIAALAVTTAKINTAAVTYAKIQDISATARILGRKTSGSGPTEECTLSEILDFITSAAQGDILYRGAATWARLAAGTSGHFLKTLGAGANPAWAAATGTPNVQSTGITIDGAGAVLSTGIKGFISVPYTGTITRFRLLSTDAAALTGSCVIDIWKLAYATSYPPAVGNTIFGGGSTKPNLSSTRSYDTATMTGVTTAVTAGDVLGFNIDSVSTITRLVIEVWIQPS